MSNERARAAAEPSQATPRARKKDKRSIATEANIRAALLAVMRAKPFHQISVTDVCKEADVSRVTFYSHYETTADVLDEVLDEVAFSVSDGPVSPFSACAKAGVDGGEGSVEGIPLCELACKDDALQPVFADPTVSKMLISKIIDNALESLGVPDSYKSLSPDQYRSMMTFRMNGCLAAIQMTREQGIEWSRAKDVIDGFIVSGMRGIG